MSKCDERRNNCNLEKGKGTNLSSKDGDCSEQPERTQSTTRRKRSNQLSKNVHLSKKIKLESDEYQHDQPDIFLRSSSKLRRNETKPFIKEQLGALVKDEPTSSKGNSKFRGNYENNDFEFRNQGDFNENCDTLKIEFKIGSEEWETSMLSDYTNIDHQTSLNIIRLFKNDCTIPFIARYRRHLTNNMDADKLRFVKSCYEDIKALESKVSSAIKQIQKNGNLTNDIKESILEVRSLEELEYVYAPFKKSKTMSKVEEAKALGLEKITLDILNGRITSPDKCVKDKKDRDGIIIIMANIIYRDEDFTAYLRQKVNEANIKLRSHRINNKEIDVDGKFELYYNFESPIRYIKPYQVNCVVIHAQRNKEHVPIVESAYCHVKQIIKYEYDR